MGKRMRPCGRRILGIINRAMNRAILLVAWGASSLQGQKGLMKFENFCRARFVRTPIRWAYTSAVLRERLASQRQKSDSVRKALMRLYYENFRKVCIQPLQTISGHEYNDVCASAADISRQTGMLCSVGAPLLRIPRDAPRVAEALLRHFPAERAPGEDVIFMGHGAKHDAVSLYEDLDQSLSSLDCHARIGAMNGRPDLDELLGRLSSRRVWLLPLLSAIGKHALADMAGDGPQSWRSRIMAQGHDCIAILRGTAEYEAVAEIWLNNLEAAFRQAAV